MREFVMRLERALDVLRRWAGPLSWGMLVVFCVQRTTDVANLIYKVVLGRVLPGEDFGAIDPIFSTLALVSLPIVILFQVAVKSISRLRAMGRHDALRALLADLVRVSAGGTVVVLLLYAVFRDAVFVRLHLDGGTYGVAVALLLALVWWQPLVGAVVQGELRYRLMMVTNGVVLLATVGLLIVLVVVMELGLVGALFTRIGAAGAGLIVGAVLLRRVLDGGRKRDPDEMRAMREMLLPMAGYAIAMGLLLHFDRLFVRNFLLAESGGYGAVVTLGTIPFYLTAPIVFVVFPMAAAEHASGRNFGKYVRQAIFLGLGVTIASAAALAAVAKPVLLAWNGPAFGPYAGYVWLCAVATGLHGLIDIVASVEIARHRYRCVWLVLTPAIAMCAVLYFGRSAPTLLWILGVTVGARAVILLALGTSVWFQARRGAPAAVR